ncbi:putative monovalent cation/H+ antiporter subunit A [Aureimonas jatrophae]|uniref:Multisubunit sodium/proton antiporter, MrpA subunit n=1 Tax=Aureimonas jatrophae TaxID=1166073 RepID=A0A1H0J9C3_9HYPH|nr:putative monovalent cation/H+ antiporter subunit A [Aureimonas jatrophae]MBB3951533.1 multicomponent Na+:H+ antiporter subunit A [Aureimonas jatrophae]SDO40140.1 multisubunit sodium/proton antiporter, MrpA subunit [Aureimonas jatrophae]
MNTLSDSLLFLVVALPFLGAVLAPLSIILLDRWGTIAIALFPAAALAILFQQSAQVQDRVAILFGFDWIPSFGVRFSFRLDGLSFGFAFLILFIGALVVLYSGGYMPKGARRGRFLLFIMLFMGAMLGLVLADDLVTLFVFWELTSIASFLLIGFDHEREAARRGAIQALVITGGGGLALLAGLVLIRESTGLSSMTQLIDAPDALRVGTSYVPILLLVLTGAFTKSAQMPLHVWLPNAMEAPTPVSAYLHSATMVKAGIYLLMRTFPMLGGTDLWSTILPVFGGITLVVGATLALRQSDIKLMLAYTTVASLGLLVMLIGIGTPLAIEAAVLYLFAHSLAKACLFMVAGSIDHGAGTRDIRALGGLAGKMPVTFVCALLGAAAMGGLPPLFGFLAKEEVYAATATADPIGFVTTAAALVGNALMFAVALQVAIRPFVGPLPSGLRRAHETHVLIWIGPLVLGIIGLLAAIFSVTTHQFISNPMSPPDPSGALAVDIALGFHWGPALILSIATVVLGAVLFWRAARARATIAGWLTRIGWGPDRGFDQFMRGLVQVSYKVTIALQPGLLDVYMRVTLAVIVGTVWVTMVWTNSLPSWPGMPHLFFYEWAVIGIIVIGVLVVVLAASRLTAVVSLGIQGLAVALLFMLLGAPDLSFTQFMVEVLSVSILALVMTRLRLMPADKRPWRDMGAEAALSVAGGLGLALFLLAIVQRPFDTAVTDFYERYSYTIAHGRNIVNVILVDFRGVDTMGEIAVVLTTGAAILALVRIRAAKPDARHSRKRRRRAGELQA